MNPQELSGSTLAYIGDAVWSLMVREYLVSQGISKAGDLQKQTIQYVSAKAQAAFYHRLEEEKWFSEEELMIFHRGRNHSSHSVPKNTDVITYRISTGFEALVGYWYLTKNETRLKLFWDKLRTEKEK